MQGDTATAEGGGQLPAHDDGVLLETARRAATSGARVHLRARAEGPAAWNEKGRSDFVTEVDLEAEHRIVEVIRGRFPEHAIVAEEGTADTDSSRGAPIRWIVDPLDGTTNWLHGFPEYAVSVAAEDGEGLRVAVVVHSVTGEVFEAVRGGGSRRDGEPIRVSEISQLRFALVGTGFPFKKLEVLSRYLRTFDRVLRSTAGIRRGGAAALDLCHLACGRLDAFWEYWLMPWDVAAGALIVREAGGVFEPLDVPGLGLDADPSAGSPAGLRPGGFLAANSRLAPDFRQLVREAS